MVEGPVEGAVEGPGEGTEGEESDSCQAVGGKSGV
jgi:hypothetical protein